MYARRFFPVGSDVPPMRWTPEISPSGDVFDNYRSVRFAVRDATKVPPQQTAYIRFMEKKGNAGTQMLDQTRIHRRTLS